MPTTINLMKKTWINLATSFLKQTETSLNLNERLLNFYLVLRETTFTDQINLNAT